MTFKWGFALLSVLFGCTHAHGHTKEERNKEFEMCHRVQSKPGMILCAGRVGDEWLLISSDSQVLITSGSNDPRPQAKVWTFVQKPESMRYKWPQLYRTLVDNDTNANGANQSNGIPPWKCFTTQAPSGATMLLFTRSDSESVVQLDTTTGRLLNYSDQFLNKQVLSSTGSTNYVLQQEGHYFTTLHEIRHTMDSSGRLLFSGQTLDKYMRLCRTSPRTVRGYSVQSNFKCAHPFGLRVFTGFVHGQSIYLVGQFRYYAFNERAYSFGKPVHLRAAVTANLVQCADEINPYKDNNGYSLPALGFFSYSCLAALVYTLICKHFSFQPPPKGPKLNNPGPIHFSYIA